MGKADLGKAPWGEFWDVYARIRLLWTLAAIRG